MREEYPFPSKRAEEMWNLLYPKEYWEEVRKDYQECLMKILQNNIIL